MDVISSLGGIWSSLFGGLALGYKIVLWIWGKVRKEYEKRYGGNTPEPKEGDSPAIVPKADSSRLVELISPAGN